MLLRVLGTRGEVKPSAPYHARHSGVLIDRKIMLDLGEKEFLNYQPLSVFLTHLHPDHAFFINNKTAGTTVPLYSPEEYHNAVDVRAISDKVTVDSYRITPIPTHHSKRVASSAYLVQQGGQRILYTGDLIWINKEYHHIFQSVNLVITEASFLRKGGMVRRDRATGQIYGHNGIPDLINLFKDATKHILFVHFGAWFYEGAAAARRKLRDLGRSSGMTVHVGYDGMEMDIAELA